MGTDDAAGDTKRFLLGLEVSLFLYATDGIFILLKKLPYIVIHVHHHISSLI